MGEPAWLDTDQQRLWRAYLDGHARFLVAVGDYHERHGAPTLSEYELLVRLSESPDRAMRMSVLAGDLARSRSRVTHTVDRMESRGWLERRPHHTDRRGVECVLTEAGFQALVEAAPVHVAAVRRYMVDVLTPAEFRALGEAMAKVGAAAKAESP